MNAQEMKSASMLSVTVGDLKLTAVGGLKTRSAESLLNNLPGGAPLERCSCGWSLRYTMPTGYARRTKTYCLSFQP